VERQNEIEALLRKAAPVCYEVARDAQDAAVEIMATDVARKYLTRLAAANQVGGLAQWRIVGDMLVRRHSELPRELRLSTTDAEQNQGLYYFRSVKPALILTVRREPHLEKDEPRALQLQMASVVAEAEVDFGGPVVTAYLMVPPSGREPMFEVTTRGESLTYRLSELVGKRDGVEGVEASISKLPAVEGSAALVKSAEDAVQADEQENADNSRS
jgi:hypothetical protein